MQRESKLKQKKSQRLVFFSLLIVSILCSILQNAVADGKVRGYVIIKTLPTVPISQILERYKTRLVDRVSGSTIYSIRVPSGKNAENFVAELSSDTDLTFAEEDTFIEHSELRGSQIHVAFDAGQNSGNYNNQYAYTQIHIGNAHSRTTGAGVIVAVLDTGATYSHPALRGHYVAGTNFINPNRLPFDLPDGITNIAVGHGTMMAGIILKIAPNARIMPIRVLNGDGIGTAFNVAQGIRYAMRNGARVINMSLGSRQRSKAIEDAVQEARNINVVCVASAGNHGLPVQQYPTSQHELISVTSVESNNVKSGYSDFGSWISVSAPGTSIRSTYWNGGYANWSGTSFAAPFVAGEAALIISIRPNLRSREVKDAILRQAHSVDSFNPNYRGRLGSGLIDIEETIRQLR